MDASASGTWVVVGASRGIGLEFVRQLLAQGKQVIAAVRDPGTASQLWQITASQSRPGSCLIEQCDVTSEASIKAFADRLKKTVDRGMKISNVVLNAGVLQYPNRATTITYAQFTLHLHTNTIGPILCAQSLLNLSPIGPPSKVVFISSDSGSATLFRDHEDGFGAYAASKAALNQMLRHMAAELKRMGGAWDEVCLLAMHPGEVAT
ncbi:uncharacterized protein HMPREF1541_03934 [Cyphellophora europaea CBS 101466]|uniref:Uncharacterized protein n=1 Tax=Cyphellophora europaea (strain CBS 101466) TaxID=1220924 RepID=W2S076_CYPE1|nr:uncharacterized protein HMPREF1541_03934 [Cyphellophora europaea CBS 101466]ETN41995.1 hypothetical protein HMPREF1541_03934 [Cyphellophora europaea CBS 101466]